MTQVSQIAQVTPATNPATSPLHIGILLFPKVTQLDMTGPIQVLSRLPGAQIHLLWKTCEPVQTDAGFCIHPTAMFADCPQLDVLCVPGGFGVVDLFNDMETIAFLQQQAGHVRYLTSVCNGSLVLAAAGLLKGYRSACHWMWRDYLPQFGGIPVNARVVHDRNRWSGGGVTAGIDFAFRLAAEIAGEEFAKNLQLMLEYDPQAPFDCGTPEKAGGTRVTQIRAAMGERVRSMEAQMEVAAQRCLSDADAAVV